MFPLALLGLGLLASTPHHEKLTTVEVRFACAPAKDQFVELAASWPTPVPIPAGCAEAGSAVKLTVRCTEASCRGTAELSGKVHPLAGSNRRVTLADRAPSFTLEGLELDVLRTRTQPVDVSPLARAPLWIGLSFAKAHRKMSFRATPGQGVWASLDPAHEDRSFELIVDRAARGRVRVRIWNLAGAQLLDRTMPLKTSQSISCEKLAGACNGTLELDVHEPAPSDPCSPRVADDAQVR